MKHLKKFESFSINEEFISAIEAKNIEEWSQRLKDIQEGINSLGNEIEAWNRGNQYEGPGQHYYGMEVADGKIQRDIEELRKEAIDIMERWHRIDNNFKNMEEDVAMSVRKLFGIEPNEPIVWPGKIKK
jgi:hypothetical protein